MISARIDLTRDIYNKRQADPSFIASTDSSM